MGLDEGAELVHTDAGGASLPAPEPAELAVYFPQLEIERLIGQGGMGAVYRANQRGLERTVALKILKIDTTAEPDFAQRFEREARMLASLDHRNLVTVFDYGRAGPHYYFVMEYVDGIDLRQMVRAEQASSRQVLAVVGEVCDALQYAHDQGVVHRDIKPENILVDRRGRVKILDFGLAKMMGQQSSVLTRSHQAMGTPQYMAPEQFERPLEVDHRADIYSLGVVFYELLTGELPMGRFEVPSKRVSVDARLDDVVLKTLEKQPERRYQQASQMRVDVDRIASEPAPKNRRCRRDRLRDRRARRAEKRAAAYAADRRPRRSSGQWIIVLLLLIPCGLATLAGGAFLFLGASYQAASAVAEETAVAHQSAALAARQAQLEGTPVSADPVFDAASVEAFRLDEAELERLQTALAGASARYLHSESLHAHAARAGSGELQVTVQPFAAEHRSITDSVRQTARSVVDSEHEAEALIEVLDLGQRFPFGEERVHLTIEDSGGIWRARWSDSGGAHNVVATSVEDFKFRRFLESP